MIPYIISIAPILAAVLLASVITYFFCRLWYTKNYVHHNEVRPIQEAQYIMQNQYAALAERIKHAEAQLAEAKLKLESETKGHIQTKLQLATAENQLAANPGISEQLAQLLDLYKKLSSETEAMNTLLAGQMVSVRKTGDDHFAIPALQKRV